MRLELFSNQEDPLGDRLEELQSNAMVAAARAPRRRTGGGFVNSFLYLVSLVRAGTAGCADTEKELNAGRHAQQAGARRCMRSDHLLFMLLLLARHAVSAAGQGRRRHARSACCRAFLLGYLIPQQVLHRLVRRYRRKLQEALPDTVDLLGIVLGTGLALDQAMMRVSEEMQYIYPELASEFYTVVMQVRAGPGAQRGLPAARAPHRASRISSLWPR